MTSAAIVASELVVRFPQQQGWRSLLRRDPGAVALDHLSLAVDRGEICGLLGPNGAGKTTLVKVIATLTLPTAGTVTVDGLDVRSHGLAVRRKLGVVYGDERTFYWRLSALENLAFYASLYGMSRREAKRRAMELLEVVGISHAADVRMHHFSSGMRQRVSIARGLLHDPDILIMDEPTRTLDPVGSEELRSLIKERVVGEHRCVLIATNIMAEAEYLCDRLAFINHGAIQVSGSVSDLRDFIEADDVYELTVGPLGRATLDELRRIRGVTAVESLPMADGRRLVRLGIERGRPSIPAVIGHVVTSGGSVWSCERRDLPLEEVFSRIAKGQPRVPREEVPA